jgi:hypothetical protein
MATAAAIIEGFIVLFLSLVEGREPVGARARAFVATAPAALRISTPM